VSESPSFTCPRCGSVSYNPNDIRERYCGRCHAFVDDPPAACAACGASQPFGRIRCLECGKPLVFPVRQ
jgi:predicted amidophosphoribosyltransferase